MTELSDDVFHLMLSIATGGLAAAWLIHDLLLLLRLPGSQRRDPLVRDQRFGYVMGIVIGVIGLVGTARFNGLL
jgi:hypothetical protein